MSYLRPTEDKEGAMIIQLACETKYVLLIGGRYRSRGSFNENEILVSLTAGGRHYDTVSDGKESEI